MRPLQGSYRTDECGEKVCNCCRCRRHPRANREAAGPSYRGASERLKSSIFDFRPVWREKPTRNNFPCRARLAAPYEYRPAMVPGVRVAACHGAGSDILRAGTVPLPAAVPGTVHSKCLSFWGNLRVAAESESAVWDWGRLWSSRRDDDPQARKFVN